MAQQKKSKKYEWDFSEIFASQKDFDKALKRLSVLLKKITSYRGKLKKASESTYVEFYKDSKKINSLMEQVQVYSNLIAIDSTNPQYGTNYALVSNLMKQYSQQTYWVGEEIRQLGEKKILSYVKNTKILSHLEFDVKEYFRMEKFHLKKEHEEFISNFGELFSSPSTLYEAVAHKDRKFQTIKKDDKGKPIKLTSTEITNILTYSSPKEDQEFRQQVMNLENLQYAEKNNLYATLYKTLINKETMVAKLKGFNSALHYGLWSDYVPDSIYLNFIDQAYKNESKMAEWYRIHRTELKKRGVRRYFRTDAALPITPLTPALQKKFVFCVDESIKITMEALKPLGKEFEEGMLDSLKPGRIDYHEREGKTQGGFSMSTTATPAYILTNWSNDLMSLMTLAHEVGHSTHSYLAKKAQKEEYQDYSILVAEIASTFCELMISDYLEENRFKVKAEVLNLLQKDIRRFGSLYFNVAVEANFELKAKQAAFEGKLITKEFLNDLSRDTVLTKTSFDCPKKEYIGLDLGLNWPKLLHHYTTTFYLYKYAISFVVSCNLFKHYKETGDTSGFINLLKAGGNGHPIDLIKKNTGVDLTDPHSHDALFELLEEKVSKAKGLIS